MSAALARRAKPAPRDTRGFGVPNVVDPHHFVVEIPAAARGDVEVREIFGVRQSGSVGGGMDEVVRAIVERWKWSAISSEVKRHFNERLRSEGMKTARFAAGENMVNRLLGKELCVLAWAIEHAEEAVIGRAVRNWLGLSPAERWWLYSMTAAASGRAEDGDRGWRKALHFALTENPDEMELAGRIAARKTRRKVGDDQLSLLQEF